MTFINTHSDEPRRLKVAAYARVSTDHERQVSSIAAQISHYSRLIQFNPASTYTGIFCDDGITGTSIKERQGFTALMNPARDDEVDLILTKTIYRFVHPTPIRPAPAVRELKALGMAVRF